MIYFHLIVLFCYDDIMFVFTCPNSMKIQVVYEPKLCLKFYKRQKLLLIIIIC